MMDVSVRIPVGKYLVVVAGGKPATPQVDTFLDMHRGAWRENDVKFAFMCRDWLQACGFTARVVSNEQLPWYQRCILSSALAVERWQKERSKV